MEQKNTEERMKEAVRLTAPGQPLRTALDMIIAGHIGALIPGSRCAPRST